MAEAASTGMVSPEQLSQRIQTGQLETEAQRKLINTISQQMVDMSKDNNQFIGNSTETPATLLAKQNASLEAQRKVQNVVNASNWESLSVSLGQSLASLAERRGAIDEKIIKDSSVSLWEDPLLALANAFTLPWDQQALNSIDQSIEKTSTAMQKINTHVQQAAVTADKIKEDVTLAGIEQTSAAIANLFAGKTLAAQMEAAKNNVAGIDAVLRMDQAQTAAYMQAKQLANMEENQKIARQRADQANQLFQEQIGKIKDEKKAKETRLYLVNLALVKEGKNPFTMATFDNHLLGKPGLMQQLLEKGVDIEVNGGKDYSQGSTIAEIFTLQRELNYQPKLPQQERVREWQAVALEGGAATATGTGKDKSFSAMQNAEKAFGDKWNTEQNLISEGSPFKAPAWKVFAERSPEISNNPIWVKYVTPLLTDKSYASQSVDEGVVMKAVTNAIVNKEATSAQAVDFMTHVFTKSAAINNEVLEFKRIANKEQLKYGVRMRLGGDIGKTSVNLMDKTEVTAAITRELVGQLTGTLMQGREMGTMGDPAVGVLSGAIYGTR